MTEQEYLIQRRHYLPLLRANGDKPEAVGWCAANQARRFAALTDGWDLSKSILDVGCGLGHLYDWLAAHSQTAVYYRGVDLLEEYVNAANIRLHSRLCSLLDAESEPLPHCDYAIASGLFNVKLGDYGERNRTLLPNIVRAMLEAATVAVAFDCLLDSHPYKVDRQHYYGYDWLEALCRAISVNYAHVTSTDAGLSGNMIVQITKQPKEELSDADSRADLNGQAQGQAGH